MLSRTFTLLSIMAVLSGCDLYSSNDSTAVKLQSKASASKDLKVSSYQVQAVFKAEGKTQQQATLFLTDRIAGFERWVKNEKFNMNSNGAQLSGVYHYTPEKIRALVAYEASVDFLLSELSFMQYQSIMASAPSYVPHQLRLLNVSASDEDKAEVKSMLIHQAFSAAKLKADAMASAANLCDVRVAEMTENSHENGSPRMMQMEMAGAKSNSSIHQSESKKTIVVNLNVNWLANTCDK
jgi:uncharacterized protein YggE